MATRKPLFISGEGFSEEMAAADDIVLGSLAIGSGGNITVSGGGELTGLPATPTGDTAAASKAYVDSVVQGLDVHESVVVATTGPGTLATSFANGQTIDGITLSTGDRILIKDQVSGVENGIYIVQASGAPVRADDWAVGYAAAGAFAFVEEGTANADSGWVCTNNAGSDVTGTDALTFSQFSGAGQITAGDGLTKTGNTLDVGAGNGIAVAADSVAVDSDTETGGNIQGVNLTANGVGLDVNAIAGTGLEADGSANLRIAAAAAGDGLTGGAGSALAVNLEASNPSLQIVTDELGLKIDASGGLQKGAAGVGLKLDDTPDTLDVDSDGLKVVGLPALFKLAGTAVGSDVTAANLDTLTDGSNADALHVHADQPATEAPRVENTLTTATDATANGDPVYVNGSATVGKGDSAVDAKARLIGVIRTGAGAAGSSVEVVSEGICAGVLSGATPGTPYYLQSGGGIGTALPGASNRLITVGYAWTATDLWVEMRDYGKKAA